MSTLYSCINCGVDVDEDAPTLFNDDLGDDMPHCYFCYEVIRQHSTQFAEFRNAFYYTGMTLQHDLVDIGSFCQHIAKRVDPNVNCLQFVNDNMTNLRSSHVGFMDGGKACPAAEVPERFDRLMNMWSADMGENVDVWIKQLLDIHPWQDANGRTASIVRNWMLGRMADPEPLPFYYGEQGET